MKKLFDGFLDQPNSGIMDIATALGVEPSVFLPVSERRVRPTHH